VPDTVRPRLARVEVRQLLLVAGMVAAVLELVMIWAIRYAGYDAVDQTVSELTAVGVATRPLLVVLGLVWQLLVIAFGGGVLLSAGSSRLLRAAGALLVAYGLLGLAWPFAAMHPREVLAAGGATGSDTAHLLLVAVGSALVLAVIVCAAVPGRVWFRVYSAATVVALLGFGLPTALAAPQVQADGPTPLAGLWERLNIVAMLAWFVVLALALLPEPGRARTFPRPAVERDRVPA
jgi:hypothetical protein